MFLSENKMLRPLNSKSSPKTLSQCTVQQIWFEATAAEVVGSTANTHQDGREYSNSYQWVIARGKLSLFFVLNGMFCITSSSVIVGVVSEIANERNANDAKLAPQPHANAIDPRIAERE